MIEKELAPLIEHLDTAFQKLVTKASRGEERLSLEEGLQLFALDLGLLGMLSEQRNNRLNQDKVFFNKNFHIEPTNVCVFSCNFCSYSRLYAKRDEGWELSLEQMLDKVKSYDDKDVTEVHIVGGVHPKMNLEFFCELISKIKTHRPTLHIKGFTAVELDYMFRKARLSVEAGMSKLKDSGLDSLPGGGAEIFDEEIRKQICADKVDTKGWLHIHQVAHELDMPSNATMLYGHIENYEHRIKHMSLLRDLQDKTKGFNTFIPLKFLNQDNDMSHITQSTIIEDLKMYAVARLFLDNFQHLKAYWPMMGKSIAQLSLSFGVNDLDGTIDDSTKIYAMAGSEEQNPSMSTEEIVNLIQSANKIAIERNTCYETIQQF